MQLFIKHAYGWTCRHCSTHTEATATTTTTTTNEDATTTAAPHTNPPLPRFFTEGEAEERAPKLSAPGLARWRDDSHQILFCPRCGVEEAISAEG